MEVIRNCIFLLEAIACLLLLALKYQSYTGALCGSFFGLFYSAFFSFLNFYFLLLPIKSHLIDINFAALVSRRH